VALWIREDVIVWPLPITSERRRQLTSRVVSMKLQIWPRTAGVKTRAQRGAGAQANHRLRSRTA
jgi:hypothetical protein